MTRQGRGPSWEQFSQAWKLTLGSAVIVWGVVVTSNEAPGALPYVLVSGLGLMGLTISVPWERKQKDDEG